MTTMNILRSVTLAGGLLLPISGIAHEALVEHANPHESVLADLLPATDLIVGIAFAMLVVAGAVYRIARRKA